LSARPRPVLRVGYESRSAAEALQDNGSILAAFEFGKSPLEATGPRHVPLALRQLDSRSQVEIWRCDGTLETGRWQGLGFARSDELTMGHLALDLRRFDNMRAASYEAYRLVQGFLRQSAHHCPMKIWNYIPGINVGAGDAERYRQFCVGRAEALSADPAEQPPMPAATAIGSPASEPALQVYFLATALPGVNVENPRQLNAWHYPRQYGPRSPLFSRGTLMQFDRARQFLISGTASVIGHRTHHDNALDQVGESLRNVNSLLGEAQRLLGGERTRLGESGILRVYIRNEQDFPALKEKLDRIVPAAMPRVHLLGDICRSDLLTEVDGIVACD
jgi:chorismate lyase/3-hydroxybenzoate synthase